MTRGSLVVVIALTGALTAAVASPHAQRFTSVAEAVRVDVLVMDGKKAVRGLTAADFEVRDADVVQDVRQVEVERLPLNLICVFDTSGSVAGPRLRNLLEAGHALVAGLHPQDRVALASFASRVRLHAALTAERGPILAGLESLAARGTTSLRDAAFAGLALREGDPGRTLLLLFSDGADTSSWLPATRVLEAATRTDVVVYPVALRERTVIRTMTTNSTFSMPSASSQPPVAMLPPLVTTTVESSKFLESLAEETGGRVVLVESDKDLQATFVATLAEFRDRYVLTYVPKGVAAGGWHPLAVRLKGKSGKVTARRGYFAN